MKFIVKIIGVGLLLSCFLFSKGQIVYLTKYKSEADKIIFVTKYKHEADALVHTTKYKSEANSWSGLWYWTNYKSEADWKLFLIVVSLIGSVCKILIEHSYQKGYKDGYKKNLQKRKDSEEV